MAGHTGRTLFAALVAFASIMLASCGGGGDGGAIDDGPSAGANYFPLDEGSRRAYTSADGSGFVDGVRGRQSVLGRLGTRVESADASGFVWSERVYVVTADGVYVYAPDGADHSVRPFTDMRVMRLPSRPGDSFVQIDASTNFGVDVDGDGREEQQAVRVDVMVIGFESVATAAGTFERVLHQQRRVRTSLVLSSGQAPYTSSWTIDEWYAPDVGLVKMSESFDDGADVAWSASLTTYRVGDRRSESVAPRVTALTPPAAGSAYGSMGPLTVEFSEAMDPWSLNPESFTVRNAAGEPVPGTISRNGASVQFWPPAAWGSEPYVLRVDPQVQDLAGNTLSAPVSWSFAVDVVAPGVVRTTPADGASDVELATPIVIEFSEPLDPASAASAQVSASGAQESIAMTVAIDGSRVIATPTAPLPPGRTIQVTVSGLKDRAGNPMQASWFSFSTTQGRFAYPVPLYPGSSALAMAVGDVNGDAIADVLLSTGGGLGPPGLILFAGQADGTLGASRRITVDVRFYGCPVEAIDIGDANGDARADVVIGNPCGQIQVLRQQVDGTLVPAESLTHAGVRVLRLADLDGDGRLALVALGGDAVTVWRRDASGSLAPSAAPPYPLSGRDIEVGDIDGNGRPDLVLVGAWPSEVSLVRRQPDDSWAAPVILTTGHAWGASAVALGDLNGDGRTDIAVSTGGNSPTWIAVFYQRADGTPGPATAVATYDIPFAISTADMNGDGRTDLIVSHQGWNAVGIYLQQADGTLAAEKRFAAPYGNWIEGSMAVGDVNRDGWPDIAIAGEMILQRPGDVTPFAARVRPHGMAGPSVRPGGR